MLQSDISKNAEMTFDTPVPVNYVMIMACHPTGISEVLGSIPTLNSQIFSVVSSHVATLISSQRYKALCVRENEKFIAICLN